MSRLFAEDNPATIEWTDAAKTYGTSTLRLTILSETLNMHVEYIKVKCVTPRAKGQFSTIQAIDAQHDNKLETVASVMSDDQFSVIKIGGRDYVVLITPFDR